MSSLQQTDVLGNHTVKQIAIEYDIRFYLTGAARKRFDIVFNFILSSSNSITNGISY